jgi:hypothetical protein
LVYWRIPSRDRIELVVYLFHQLARYSILFRGKQTTDGRQILPKKMDSDPTEEFSTKITQELKIMKEYGYIDRDTFGYLKPDKPTSGRFYLLPKIHQANNPGRSIVSATCFDTVIKWDVSV